MMRPILNLLKNQQTTGHIVKSIITTTNRNVLCDFKRHFGSTYVNHASPTTEKLPIRILLLGSPVCIYNEKKLSYYTQRLLKHENISIRELEKELSPLVYN